MPDHLSRHTLRFPLVAVTVPVLWLAACGGGSAETPPVSPPRADTIRLPVPDTLPRSAPPRDTAPTPRPDPKPEPPVVKEPEPEPEPEPRIPELRPDRGPNPNPVSQPPVLAGAILPRERIVAFYGNPRSTRMGILGQHPPEEMLAKLQEEVRAWERADPDTPVRPALHMIAVMAAGDPGPDSLYRLRMPTRVIEQVIGWAEQIDALVILDIQTGRSSVEAELAHLIPYLERPNVHLGLDPEWRMGPDDLPGRQIGTMRASEINHAVGILSNIVEKNGLPPKVLVLHRFTNDMIPDIEDVVQDNPRVQTVLHMDGWGRPQLKRDTYRAHVAPAPIFYKGFKLFYRNDLWNDSRMMTPSEVLGLLPAPLYIQYQ